MASTTFPLAQQSSFTPPGGTSGIKYNRLWYQPQQRRVTITGDNAGTQDTSHVYIHGVPVEELIGVGVLREAGPIVPIVQQSSLTLGTILLHAQRMTLRRSWPLVEITGPDSGNDSEFTWGVPTHYLNLAGFAKDAGPLIQTQEFSVSLDFDRVGTLSWADNAFVDSSRLYLPKERGGSNQARFAGAIAGDLSYTPDALDLSWLFDTDDPLKGQFTLDTDGETVQAYVLVYSVSFSWRGPRGGPIFVTVRMRVDKDPPP